MSTTIDDGVIDFTVPPHLQELLGRVRAFVEEDVLPAESEIEDPHDLLGDSSQGVQPARVISRRRLAAILVR